MGNKFQLPQGWTVKPIGSLGRVLTGKTPSTKNSRNFGVGIPFITPTDMDGRRIISQTGRYLTEEGVASVLSARIPKNAVMVSCIGSDMGKAAIAGCEAVTNQQINTIIVDKDISHLYVYYNLSSRKSEIQHLGSSGSAVPILNKGHFTQLPIALPPLKEQKAIACILGALDDKIELNRQMNKTLEEMARAIFKSWFVDFDPVRAKAAGQRPPGLKPEIAALFPDSFEDSELGEIPKGWRIIGLDDTATFLNGLALQRYPPENGKSLPVIKIAQLRKGSIEGADRASADIDIAYIVEDGDVLFSWSGSLECILWTGGRGALNQHLFKVTSDRFPKWFYYLWIHKHLPTFRHIAAAKATTMGHIQRHHLIEAKVIEPSAVLLAHSDKVIGPMIEAVVSRSLEINSLALVRDTLMPKLISGELRVPDAERIIKRYI